jgi:hypothetical protein
MAAANNTIVTTDVARVRMIDFAAQFTGGIAKLIERAIGSKTPDFEEVLQTFKTHYFENCMIQTKPYDGIISFCKPYKKKG